MPPAADLVRLVAIVLSVMAGAAVLAVIRLHWRAWRTVRQTAIPVRPMLARHWRAWPALRARQGVARATLAVLRLNTRAIIRLGDAPGLTPFHVWAVSTAHGMLLFAIAIGLVDQLGQPGVTWRVALYIAAPVITLAALWAVGLSQRRRIAGTPVVVVEKTTRTEIR